MYFCVCKVKVLWLETEEKTKKQKSAQGFRAFRSFDILMFIWSEIPPELDLVGLGLFGSSSGLNMPG